ncbi:hypothetical protein FIU86_02565 [Roseovarius sp. THAF9]|uniref:YidH family protein n=1 Tax=Roseovarius sp. THAF9 TaxID=2587847 RepID=UPI001268C876|nr:DUF202 domain-containing protein [Roseovarius sp. THAF9]QFT91709.1 hypothetical protein FIU86_02565 [Roseovarius sp. THAF9]
MPQDDADHGEQDKKTRWAENRTDWASDRTILANERTFNSWMGTGLGAVGVAIGLKAVFGAFEPTWAAKAVASVFLVIAIVVFWAARHQARKTISSMETYDAAPMPTRNFTLLASLMTIATLATGAILWSL